MANEPIQDEDSDNHQEGFEEITSTNHITVQVIEEPSLDGELEKALPIFEERGQATIDELKELNLDTEEDP